MAESHATDEHQALETLEQEFADVLDELAADSTLDRFREEYEKLHQALKQSHESERKLIAKCRELSSDIGVNAQKVQAALRMTQEDSQTISYLKGELEKTYKILELCKEREEKSKQKIDSLQQEIQNISALIEKANALTQTPTVSVQDLLLAKDELMKEKEVYQVQIQNAKQELADIDDKAQTIAKELYDLDEEIQILQLRKDEYLAQADHDEFEKKAFQEKLESIKVEFDSVRVLHDGLQAEYQQLKADREQLHIVQHEREKHLNQLIKEERISLKEREKHEIILTRYQQDFDEFINTVRQTEIAINQYSEENKKLLATNEKIVERQDDLLEQCDQLKEARNEIEALTLLAQQGINDLENQISLELRSAQDDRSFINEIHRNQEVLRKDLDRVENNNRLQNEKKIDKLNDLRKKENEYSAITKTLENLGSDLKQKEAEKEKYSQLAIQANAKYFQCVEEGKMKDNLIAEFQKRLSEIQIKLKQQQTLYETVRSDKNLYSKILFERSEEKAEIQRRYQTINHSISQLKEEIDAKEIKLNKEHFEHKKKDKTIEEQVKTLVKFKRDIKAKEDHVKVYLQDINKLQLMIKASEQRKQKLYEEYELVLSERDILGTQLIRRTTEDELLYERIKINQSALKKGEIQYTERLSDIMLLKSQIADLMNEIKTLKTEADHIAEMKTEIHTLQRELIDEQLKVRALTEDLASPMNIHRWRRLEATDKDTYQLICKIQSLQRRLIQKSKELVEKQEEIKTRENKMQRLEGSMQRHPSENDQKLIEKYRQTSHQKSIQLKAMQKELVDYQTTVDQYKLEATRIQTEITLIKEKYYRDKKRIGS